MRTRLLATVAVLAAVAAVALAHHLGYEAGRSQGSLEGYALARRDAASGWDRGDGLHPSAQPVALIGDSIQTLDQECWRTVTNSQPSAWTCRPRVVKAPPR